MRPTLHRSTPGFTLCVGVLTALVVALSACSEGGSAQPPEDSYPIPISAKQTPYEEVLPCLALRLELGPKPPNSAALPFTLKVKNSCAEPVRWFLSNSPPHDFVVSRRQREVWNFLGDKIVQQPIMQMDMKPAQEEVFSGEWDLRLANGELIPSGTYSVEASLSSTSMTGRDYQSVQTKRLQFVVPPRPRTD